MAAQAPPLQKNEPSYVRSGGNLPPWAYLIRRKPRFMPHSFVYAILKAAQTPPQTSNPRPLK